MEQKPRKCNTYRPICISAAFMFGILLGNVIGREHTIPEILLSTGIATVVFHYAFAKNFNFKGLINKVVKKGS